MDDILIIYVDSVGRNTEEKTLTVFGWAINNATHEVADIQVEDNPVIEDVQIEKVPRNDVNPIYHLPDDAECGFYITIKVTEFKGVLFITFKKGGEIEEVILDLNKRYSHLMEEGNPSRKYYEMYQKVEKYFKRNGVKESIKGLARRFTNTDYFYEQWIAINETETLENYADVLKDISERPLISVIIPVRNVTQRHLTRSVQSVMEQYYDNWEICIIDDCSILNNVPKTINALLAKDARIKAIRRKKYGQFSRACNDGVALAKGEFVLFLDGNDTIAPNALAEAVLYLNAHPRTDIIYGDEDNLFAIDKRKTPYFKTDWAPDSLMSCNYIRHGCFYRKSLIDDVGGFRIGFEGIGEYDLLLRVTEKTDRIGHVPRVIYHYRAEEHKPPRNSTIRDLTENAGIRALRDALKRRNIEGDVIKSNLHGYYHVHYAIKDKHLVSIIIPTRDGADYLRTCIDSILEKTEYADYEIVIADNGSVEKETFELFDYYTNNYPDRVKIERIDIPFNFARINNLAVEKADGDMLLFLNNDTEVIHGDWLTRMVALAQMPHVGAVGAKLYYPDDTIQHAGVVVGIGGGAGHIHYNFPKDSAGYYGRLAYTGNYLSVTGACLMVRRNVFETVGGFTEEFVVAFNDIDLCLKIYELGLFNVWTPEAELYHFESKSRGYEDTPEKKRRFTGEVNMLKEKWSKYIENDPFYNPNLTRLKSDFSINLD